MADGDERGGVRTAVFGTLATVVRWVGLLCALALVAHVVLVMGEANPDNPITRLLREVADPLALAFRDLFTPADGKLRVLVNYGLAAVFWLVVSSVVARLLRRVG